MTPLRLEFVDAADLKRLRPAWEALCDRSPRATAFQRPEWMLPWIDHFGPCEPWIATVWDGRSLIGVAPLFVWRDDFGERAVSLLGAGISDYLDVICEPRRGAEVAREVLAALGARRGKWDRCRLEDLPACSPLCSAPAPPDIASSLEEEGAFWRLDIRSRDRSFGWLGGRRRTKLFAELRRADRDHGLALRSSTPATLARDWTILEGLHGARWRARGADGMLATRELRAFHRQVAAGFARRGRLALYTLTLGGCPAACLYGFEDTRTLYYYLGGFDPAYAPHSPGRLVIALAAEDASRRRLRVLDFLRGDEPYKRAWGAEPHPRMRRLLWPR